MYLFYLVVLGLCGCPGFSLVVASGAYSLVAVCGLLTVVAPLVVGTLAEGTWASVVAVPGLQGMCGLPGSGVEPVCLLHAAAAAAKSLQSCPTLCNPRDGSPPGSPIPGILQARTMEWVAISFSNA